MFRHEALLYADLDEFLQGTLGFARDAVGAGEPILVAVSALKIGLLREALGEEADRVAFLDMAGLGVNPARIIPAWRAFVDEHAGAGRPLRGIGEPVWPGRSAAEIAECHRHEALLNLAFADTPGFWLVCPYDTSGLEPHVLAGAHCSHPLITTATGTLASERYAGAPTAPLDESLPEPASVAAQLPFDAAMLGAVRELVSEQAATAGLTDARGRDLMLAVNEIATNSVRHATGHGLLRIWQDDGALVCEVRDDGCIDEPLAGRVRPVADRAGGHGLWLVNQLCELVQLRVLSEENVVRLHMRLG